MFCYKTGFVADETFDWYQNFETNRKFGMELVELIASGNLVEITSHPQRCQVSALCVCWHGLALMHN